MKGLDAPMTGNGCCAELFSAQYRDRLKAACAEDGAIWQIYANNFGPDGFDASIDTYTSNPRNRTFVLFDGNELAGMSSYLGIDEGRQVLEIGGTYYRPKFRGTGFNRRVKDMMLRRAFDCGVRRVRVPRRPPQRTLAGGDEEARRRPRGRATRRPHHLDGPRPRHRPVRDFERRIRRLASRCPYFGLANPHCACSIGICLVMRVAFSA